VDLSGRTVRLAAVVAGGTLVSSVVALSTQLAGGVHEGQHHQAASDHTLGTPVAAAAGFVDPESVPVPPPLRLGVGSAPFGLKMVDARGVTLYAFSADVPGRSACTGACPRTWPPARSYGGKPQPGPGSDPVSVGSIQREDGSNQVTFNGRPVYFYTGDHGPGQTNGQGRQEFGGTWSAVPPGRPGGSAAREGSRP